jgi:hypothetical protein
MASSHMLNTMVMDLAPWPNSKGFQGTQEWWGYVLGKDEKRRLDHLLGAALLDAAICKRLIREKDDELLDAFGISENTKQWLHSVEAESLTDLAQAIVSRSA